MNKNVVPIKIRIVESVTLGEDLYNLDPHYGTCEAIQFTVPVKLGKPLTINIRSKR